MGREVPPMETDMEQKRWYWVIPVNCPMRGMHWRWLPLRWDAAGVWHVCGFPADRHATRKDAKRAGRAWVAAQGGDVAATLRELRARANAARKSNRQAQE